jgi:hypothetical protein
MVLDECPHGLATGLPSSHAYDASTEGHGCRYGSYDARLELSAWKFASILWVCVEREVEVMFWVGRPKLGNRGLGG